MVGRLPVAPRPYRDELLSSWLGRVACRYGLRAADLAGHFACGDHADCAPISVDDLAPAPGLIQLWARACGVDPQRLQRLSLVTRHPRRPPSWYSNRGPQWMPTPARHAPVCPACFDADHAAGRDGYLRADWMLAEYCVCPTHLRLLVDRCPRCHHALRVAFRLRERRAHPVCARCERTIADRGGENSAFVDAVLTAQRRIGASIEGATGGRERVEQILAALWAPLDDPGAARPVLALWFNEPGWTCPFEARHAVGVNAPLGQLPIRWRVVSMIAVGGLLGADMGISGDTPQGVLRLFRRGVPLRPVARRRPPEDMRHTQKRSSAAYLRLARAILAHPDWIAADALPQRKRQRVRAGLIDTMLLATSSASAGPP